MDFRQHDDTVIELRLTDRRGHPLRASVCEDLKIKVWTQDPRVYLSIYPRDIRQIGDRDVIVIPDWEMASLQPGVVVYRYSFREPIFGDRRHDDYYRRGDDFERSETVVTGIVWRGKTCEPLPSNPVNAHTLEHLRQVIEDLHRDISRQVRDLRRYVSEEYTDNLSDEVTRAKEAERVLSESVDAAIAKIDEEIKRSTDADIAFLGQLNQLLDVMKDLQKDIKDMGDENSSVMESLGKLIEERLVDLEKTLTEKIEKDEKKFHKALDKLNERISDELEKKAVIDSEQSLAIGNEVTRAKGEETRIENKIDELKSLANRKLKALAEDLDGIGRRVAVNSVAIEKNSAGISANAMAIEALSGSLENEVNRAKSAEALLETKASDNSSRISEEANRAKLVEKDLTEALQRLKQSVASGQTSAAEGLAALRAELIEKIDYRIKEVVGEAPEAFDTLEKIAEKLKSDDDVFKAIREILVLKANADNVYDKKTVDEFIREITNTLNTEIQRAQLAEKKNADAIEILTGDEDTIGSVEHAKADANHYTDDALKAHQREVADAIRDLSERLAGLLEDKQERGDYVSFTTADGRKCVILPNHCNIVGENRDGADGSNLIMLSRWDVVDVGSAKNPLNLNGFKKRPTYNDDYELALTDDIEDYYESLDEYTEEDILQAIAGIEV